MSRLSPKLIRAERGFIHWCPGCTTAHFIPTAATAAQEHRWDFDGNVALPTFTPSVKNTCPGERAEGAPPACCHYNLTKGVLIFHKDSTHAFASRAVPLPDLPEGYE